MGFHKHTFVIRTIPIAGREIDYKTGWANEDYTVGFAKTLNGKAWTATDIASGLSICVFPTRQACLDWIDEHAEMIAERMTEPAYVQRVMEFKILLEKEMASL